MNNNNNNNKHSLRSNTKGYGGKTHCSDTTAPSGRELLSFAILAPGGQSGNFWIYTLCHCDSRRTDSAFDGAYLISVSTISVISHDMRVVINPYTFY